MAEAVLRLSSTVPTCVSPATMPRLPILLTFLFLSGLCALIFQTAWLRELRLVFGATTPASAAVLAIFMGGLGLGNALFGPRTDRSPNPLAFYGRLELGIATASLLSPMLIQLVRSLYLAVGGQEMLGLAGATILRLLLASAVLAVPTILMGGTLPAAVRAALDSRDDQRRGVGWLYGVNTLGAVVGALLGTFFLFERLGTVTTLWLACGLNFGVAAAAIVLSRTDWAVKGIHPSMPASTEKSPTAKRGSQPAIPTMATTPLPQPQLLYAAALIVGFAFFLMELVWFRMLGPILGGSTFTFGLILAVALVGIGLGGALYPLLYRERRPTLSDFAATCGLEALTIAIPFALGDALAILAASLQPLAAYGFAGQTSGWALVTLIVVFPAALVSGIQFPLLIGLLGRGEEHIGTHVGRAYAWNTVGAIAGSLAGGFGLLPLLTAPGAWQLVVLLLALLSAGLLWLAYRQERQAIRLVPVMGILSAAALCLMATGPTALWRHGGIGAGRFGAPRTTRNEMIAWTHDVRRDVIWEADGSEASVAISARSGAAFIVNGKADGNAYSDMATQVMLSVTGVLIHPEPKTGLVIGLGTGESAGWLAHQPMIERVDVVEIEPAIRHVAEFSIPLNHDVLRHPKVKLIFNDAREVLQTTSNRYDLIVSEPSNPYRSGVSSLYTREFYRAARERLQPRGLFLQWLQGYEVDVTTVALVLKTLHDSFDHVEIWELGPVDMLLVCSNEPLRYDTDLLRTRLAIPECGQAVRVAWRTQTVEGVLSHFVANHQFTAAIATSKPAEVNTDDRNMLEYRFARTVGRREGFSIDALRRMAQLSGRNKPTGISSGVDWELVADQWIAYNVGCGEQPLDPAIFEGYRAVRAAALRRYIEATDFASIAAIWNSQPRPPQDIVETAVVALGLAENGDRAAKELTAKLADSSPLDAQAIEAILDVRLGERTAAAEKFADVFAKIRSQPPALAHVMARALDVATELAAADRTTARQLYGSLEQPFVVFLLEHRRRMALYLVGQQMGPQAVAAAIEQQEPFVPWEASFLLNRVTAYRETQHVLLPQAERDLESFTRWMPEPMEYLLDGKPTGD